MKEYYSQHVKEYKRRMRLRGEIINKIEGYVYSDAENVAFELVNRLKPTHFVTLQLKQHKKIHAINGWKMHINGDDKTFDKAYRAYVRSVSKAISARSKWNSHKEQIGNVGWIQGGDGYERNHLHIVLTKPSDVDEEAFRVTLHRLANSHSWVEDGVYAIDVQSIESAKEKINSTFYSGRKGSDRLLMV
jgi:hypothetical protein